MSSFTPLSQPHTRTSRSSRATSSYRSPFVKHVLCLFANRDGTLQSTLITNSGALRLYTAHYLFKDIATTVLKYRDYN